MLTLIYALVIPLVIPPAAIWYTRRKSEKFRQSGAARLAYIIHVLTLLPLCAATVPTAAEMITARPYNVVISTSAVAGSGTPLASIYRTPHTTQAGLHGLSGWEGVDVKGGPRGTCGHEILAPFNGKITYNGLDGYNHVDSRGVVHDQNTMLTMVSSDGVYKMTLLHGRYPLPAGTAVRQGQLIGYEDSIGWSTGCHSHVTLWKNGHIVSYLDQVASAPPQNQKPLKISWYDPALGGINCDSDCTTMASGVKVTPDRYGRTAACIREWMGRTVTIPGIGTYQCLDTGGAIREHAGYIWIDLMHTRETAPAFGQLVHNWSIK